jgi:glycine cleavage system H lipoate-binding protein
VSKFVPYSDDLAARCSDDRHQYCDILLALEGGRTIQRSDDHPAWIPDDRLFAPNHLWLDVAPDGHWHVGVDSFFAYVVGRVDRLSFLSGTAAQRPTAILTVGETDLQLVFPLNLQVTASNNRLRSQCERIVREPYAGGWLFEGASEPGSIKTDGLRSGGSVRKWMEEEMQRLNTVVQSQFATATSLLNDGGVPVPGVMRHLDRQSALAVYSEFLSPFAVWRESA